MNSEIQKLSYAFGVNIGSSLKQQGMDEADVQMLVDGINDAITGAELKMPQEELHNIIRGHFDTLQAKRAEQSLKAQKAYFEENGKVDGVVTLESGLQYQVINEGNGPKPSLTSKVNTHYHGTTLDGKVFDSSVDRGEPISFPVNGVIPGWTEALQLMSVGSKWKLFIPSALAYGERGAGSSIPPHTPLIFEVELLGIE